MLASHAAQQRQMNAFLADVERRAFRIAQIATRDRDEALDIVQDAMLQLSRRYARRPPAEWAPLFHRILENRIRDWQRRQAVRRRLFWLPLGRGARGDAEPAPAEPLEAIADASLPDAATRLAQAEAMQRLECALAALPRRQRQAFILRVWEGLDVAAAAAAMGCSDGSVKTHLFRALAALRLALEGVRP
ncbi:MAG: RNA polymerase sigma factor [Nevskia sp.]|nr:RNA polymerase sigma factor [Nevskia sp.]